MSYSDPAPFASLLAIAESIKSSVEALQSHPEGAKAFEAWMDQVDFDWRYSTRYKDLPVDHDVPETMVLVQDSFMVEDGKIRCESGYSAYYWTGSKWIGEDESDEDEDEESEEG